MSSKSTHDIVNIQFISGEDISYGDFTSLRVYGVVVRSNAIANDIVVNPAHQITINSRHSILTCANLCILRVTESIWSVDKHWSETVSEDIDNHGRRSCPGICSLICCYSCHL